VDGGDVFLWWRINRAMRPEAMDAIRSANEVFVSAASAWEVGIKPAVGEIRLDACVLAVWRDE
jgi:PIN domain nuclease of toxin-antitoxin system